MRAAIFFGCCIVLAAGHSSLIYPKPRNAIDSLLPEWSDGKAPYLWPGGPKPYHPPCVCANGTEVCESAQTCLWFSVGCSIGCKECDGGDKGGANPSFHDRCGSGMKATITDPLHRTVNRNAVAFSDDDWTRWNPWRAPGSAPVYDPCGRASGGPHATGGHGEFTNTKFAKLGDVGSKLPKFDSGVVWEAGSIVETRWAIRANHGGGFQYRLCPLSSNLTEACFQETPMPFAGNSSLMLSNGTKIELNSTFVSEGTLPVGSTWQMNPIPGYVIHSGGTKGGGWEYCKKPGPECRWFDPPCYDPKSEHPDNLGQGLCSGEWLTNITFYDKLRVPNVPAGDYVMSFRYDCEASAQIWQSCADITITA